MPPRAEYWTLTKEQFNEIKAEISEIGERILDYLQQNGFTKIKSSNDWLGVTIENREGDLLTFVGFSLVKESPREFRLISRQWNSKNPTGTCVDLYEKFFDDIEKFKSSFDSELTAIKKILLID